MIYILTTITSPQTPLLKERGLVPSESKAFCKQQVPLNSSFFANVVGFNKHNKSTKPKAPGKKNPAPGGICC